MIESIDQILIGVNDPKAATDQYQQLLGRQPSWLGYWPLFDCELTAFQLSNCRICLCSPAGNSDAADEGKELVSFLDNRGEGIFALLFGSDDLTQTRLDLAGQGIQFGPETELDTLAQTGYSKIQGRLAKITDDSCSYLRAYVFEAKDKLATQDSILKPGANTQDTIVGLDHVVVNTADANTLKINFNKLGLNLRLDQNIPEWGARQLFYRIGHTVLEVIAFNEEKLRPQANEYWGLALQAADIDKLQKRVLGLGVNVSKVRGGRKPGTRVASLKSHNLGVATLLIGPDLERGENQ